MARVTLVIAVNFGDASCFEVVLAEPEKTVVDVAGGLVDGVVELVVVFGDIRVVAVIALLGDCRRVCSESRYPRKYQRLKLP